MGAGGNARGGIIIRESENSVVAVNTVALNAMDGVQARKSDSLVIDHNTVADNGASGLLFYYDQSDDLCIRNNNITGTPSLG